jgi:SAM-dependent methyltransferase
MQTLDQHHDAFQLTVDEPAMRAYLQRYPFAMGPDAAMNARCCQTIYDNLAVRQHARPAAASLVRLKPHETQLSPEQINRLEMIMNESEIPQAPRANMIDDYGWEANLVPLDRKSVLVLGCGDGTELMFLRAVLPEAKITALDYTDSVSPACKQATRVRFFQGDMNALLAGFTQEFDLISSNHTLEHLYTPNEVLTTLAGLLLPHGVLVSTLPMDGMAGSPFLQKVKDAAIRKTVHPLDVVYLDAGHPWKTNPNDLEATMQEVGFERPHLYQREQHLSRVTAGDEKQLEAELALGVRLHTVFFGWPRSLAKLLLKNPPALLSKGMLAAERRIWFGANRLKNRYTQEVLVLACKNSGGDSLS